MNINISDNAILVSTSFKVLGIHKKDEVATDHVNSHFQSSSAKCSKALLNGRHLKGIKAVRTAVCDFIGKNTLPWSEDGKRLLPAANFDKFQSKMEDFKHQWRVEIEDFVRRWDDMLYEAATMSGQLFDKSAYPDKSEVTGKFKFSVNFSKVPSANDFRVDLISESAAAEIRKSISDQVGQEVMSGKRDILERITKNMRHLAEVLTDPNKQFRKSALTNASEMAELLKTLNVTNDTNIDSLASDAMDLLEKFNADELIDKGTEAQIEAGKKVNESLGKIEETANAIFG
jgi:hypothetical protein